MSSFPTSRSTPSPVPRLSIVVPLLGDSTRFESTLISVLENRPEHCEVIVCHDGSYDDPFDLCDEVRFAVASSDQLLDLVHAGARAAHGRFVHVIGDALQATLGWADAAIEKFEHFDCGSVMPVIRNASSDKIIAAGWQDASDRLCKPVGQGKKDASKTGVKVAGAYINGSFWRRDLLRSLHDAVSTTSVTEATVAYEYLSRKSGWRCVVATQSNLRCDSSDLVIDAPCFSRGASLRGMRGVFYQGNFASAVQSALKAAICNVARPGLLMESLGQVFGPTKSASIASRISSQYVVSCDQREVIVKFPAQDTPASVRRAA
ncbi:glycosyltransferase family 2 protein [Rubripirellula amarantea]|uniref:glycosyltransferase family 2 protein n=1 Tax=Rubripirellula amarantea TaxID=2527999 RepID=UPI0011B5F6D6|nr:glycosyltransferase family 2 protein [Rubripirellula amarantea]MDA8744011.1 glycosyltransferase family 2 protein [Rubripirellula amarantea]